jgi:hypothetical protein
MLLENYRHRDRCCFEVRNNFVGAVKAFKSTSKETIAEQRRRVAKPSERRRIKESLARKRKTKMRKAAEHLRVNIPQRRPSWSRYKERETK